MNVVPQKPLSSIGQLIADMKAFPYNDNEERFRSLPKNNPRKRLKKKAEVRKKDMHHEGPRYVCPDNEETQKKIKIACEIITNVRQESVLSSRMFPQYVRFRRIFCVVTRRRGWSLKAISFHLDRHHTSIIHLLRGADRVEEDVRAVEKYLAKHEAELQA